MKKFKFQLETLLKVTRRKKDEAEMAFAEVSRRLEEHRAQLQNLLHELQEGQAEYAGRTSEGKTITVDVIMIYTNFFNWKREQIERQQKLKKLTELITYVKSIEQLKEKRLREYNEELLAEEQKFLDEVGLQLSIRK